MVATLCGPTSNSAAGCVLPRGAHAAHNRVPGGRQSDPQSTSRQGHVVAPRQEGESPASLASQLRPGVWHAVLPAAERCCRCRSLPRGTACRWTGGVPSGWQLGLASKGCKASRWAPHELPSSSPPPCQLRTCTCRLSRLQIALDVARALVYLHSKRIIHLDLKVTLALPSQQGLQSTLSPCPGAAHPRSTGRSSRPWPQTCPPANA